MTDDKYKNKNKYTRHRILKPIHSSLHYESNIKLKYVIYIIIPDIICQFLFKGYTYF